VVGFLALTWLTSSQITWSGDLAEPVAEPGDRLLRRESVDAGLDAVAASFGAATADHALRRRGWVLRRALLLADFAAFACAAAVVELFVVKFDLADPVVAAVALALLGVWVLVALGYGLYANDEIQAVRSTADDVPGVLLLGTLLAWLSLLFLNGTGLAHPRLMAAGVFWATAIAFLLVGRASARSIVRQRFMLRERTVIVGAGRVGAEIARKLGRRPEYGLDVIGFLDDDPLIGPEDGPPHLGGTARIEPVLRAYKVERVIFAFSRLTSTEQIELFRRCMELGVQVDIVPRLYEVIGSRMQIHDVDGLPLVGLRAPRLSRSSRLMKRSLDLVVGIATLLLAAPFFAYAAIRIKLGTEGPVFFRQERMGSGGKPFQIVKFRTMVADAEERKHEVAHLNKHTENGPRMFKIPDDPRVTKFGHFLRRWSLDELPQLFNVLRGEMSLVGPRPLILAEDENIVGQGRSRLWLTPGVTGLWQVLGRSDIPFAEMITLDYLYVTNWSLWGDIKLLARTVPLVLQRRGAY
jgi:exopolysaccharide biosynthesis polyprenyl glycosylphosphotransferase